MPICDVSPKQRSCRGCRILSAAPTATAQAPGTNRAAQGLQDVTVCLDLPSLLPAAWQAPGLVAP